MRGEQEKYIYGKFADIGPTHFRLHNKMFLDGFKTCSLMGLKTLKS